MHTNGGHRNSNTNSHPLPHPKSAAFDGSTRHLLPSTQYEEFRSKLVAIDNLAVEKHSSTTKANDPDEHPAYPSIYKR